MWTPPPMYHVDPSPNVPCGPLPQCIMWTPRPIYHLNPSPNVPTWTLHPLYHVNPSPNVPTWTLHPLYHVNPSPNVLFEPLIQCILIHQVVAVTEDAHYSSSLVDTMTLFHNMVVFWKHLQWPDPEVAYGCLSALIIVSLYLHTSHGILIFRHV